MSSHNQFVLEGRRVIIKFIKSLKAKEILEFKLIEVFSNKVDCMNLSETKCSCKNTNNKRVASSSVCSVCLNTVELRKKSPCKVGSLPFSIRYHLYDMLGASVLIRATRGTDARCNILRMNKEYKLL
jgi:hypothetical protein